MQNAKYRFIEGGSDGRCTISYKHFIYYNLGQNFLGHLRKLGTKTHFAKSTHIIPLKRLGDVVIRGYFCCPPLPQAVLTVSTLHRGEGGGNVPQFDELLR